MKLTNAFSNLLGTFAIIVPMLGTAFAQTPAPPVQAASPATAVTASPYAPIVFPAKGQSQEQMNKDKADCYEWAKQQTGYDPAATALLAQNQPVPTQVTPSTTYPQSVPPPQQGGVVRGGGRGAAAGAAIGAIAGDAGKGAAIGAASGGAVGGVRQRRANEAQQQAVAQQQAAQQQAAIDQQAAQQQAISQQQAATQQKLEAYKRAFEACMEGKGYTVK